MSGRVDDVDRTPRARRAQSASWKVRRPGGASSPAPTPVAPSGYLEAAKSIGLKHACSGRSSDLCCRQAPARSRLVERNRYQGRLRPIRDRSGAGSPGRRIGESARVLVHSFHGFHNRLRQLAASRIDGAPLSWSLEGDLSLYRSLHLRSRAFCVPGMVGSIPSLGAQSEYGTGQPSLFD